MRMVQGQQDAQLLTCIQVSLAGILHRLLVPASLLCLVLLLLGWRCLSTRMDGLQHLHGHTHKVTRLLQQKECQCRGCSIKHCGGGRLEDVWTPIIPEFHIISANPDTYNNYNRNKLQTEIFTHIISSNLHVPPLQL